MSRFLYLIIAMVSLLALPVLSEEGNVQVKGVRIHYTVQGTGEPVVLLHGLYASGQMNWGFNGIIAALAQDHQVIAINFPGHGQSDKPQGDEAYGEQMVEDVVAMMDHLELKKAHLVGYSMGGMVTVKMLTTHPDRVLSAFVGGWGWMKPNSPQTITWSKLGDRDIGKTPPACLHNFGKLAVTEAELKAINIPTIVLIGERDPLKKTNVEPLQTARPDWPVIVVPEAGHLGCVMKAQFKDEIVKWIGERTGK